MATYHCKIRIPDFLDRLLAAPVVFGRWLWYGYTFRRIPLSMGKYARVDPCRFGGLSKYIWHTKKNANTYKAVRFAPEEGCNIPIYMHRQILDARKGQIVDHKDRNGLDNREDNLRFSSKSQNNFNKEGRKNAPSKYKGVSWYERYKCWRAEINCKCKNIYVGYFKSEIEAARAYDAAAKKYHGEFAYLNFPEKQEKGLKNLLRHWFTQIYTVYKRLTAEGTL